ncbi:hypothetical protein I4U23_030064 [Adineta vaga]|nr:hypothetical protein I4U23_030064 [Adineta vaga]
MEKRLKQNDCFLKFGIISSGENRNQQINEKVETQKASSEENENEQDQPTDLVEEIDAIIALIIYDTYSKKHEFTSSAQHRAKTIRYSKNIRDDIDRFDALYSCLVEQEISSKHDVGNNVLKKTNLLSKNLRNRFFTLSDIHKLKNFQEKERSRIYEERKKNFNRVPFIPNILSYQRTCPHYKLEEMKWIRDHFC